jgi:hypothetical protein
MTKEQIRQKNSTPESRAARKKYDQTHPEIRAKIRLTFNKTNPGKMAEYLSKYAAQNPEKRKAKQAVNNAVYRGKLLKTPCRDCGDPNSEGHHEDYSKPLEVIWLCRKHHKIADALRREREKTNG